MAKKDKDSEKNKQPDLIDFILRRKPRVPHYHGDTVREIFFLIGFFMLFGLPFFHEQIQFNIFFILLLVLGVNLLAGFTSPRKKLVIIFDFILSFGGLILFEFVAYFRLQTFGVLFDGYFWFAQIIAVFFFVSLYYSAKTLRGLNEKEE